MDKVNLKQLFDYDTWTYTYIIWIKDDCDAIIIDPVLEQIDRDLDCIKKLNLNLKYILETHVHADHITGASHLREITGAKICYGSKTGVKGADILFKDGDELKLGNSLVKVHHTPGHTDGCVSYYINGYIFTGDTLFIEGTGRTDFQGGSSENIYNSVRDKIFPYPDETIVYPAHNYKGINSSTIAHEKKYNPNVGECITIEEFVLNEKNKKRPYPKRFDIAVPANLNCGEKLK